MFTMFMFKKPSKSVGILALLMALLLLVACGGEETPATATTAPATDTPAVTEVEEETPEVEAEAPADDSIYPLTISHKYGETIVPSKPERVVTIGYTEHDVWVALGTQPIAVRYWYGDESEPFRPWSVGQTTSGATEVLNMAFGELNYEAILALQPDLISGIDSGITQDEYDQLTLIAPTIAQSGDFIDFGTPWQDTTRLVGQILGEAELAESLIAEVEAKFTAVRENNPHFIGKEFALAYSISAGSYGFYSSGDNRAQFFTQFGLEIPAELDEVAGESFYADLSQERIDLLDRDVLIFLGLQFIEGGRQTIENEPLLNQLNVAKDGRVVYVPVEVDDALQYGNVLSLGYAIDAVAAELEAVLSE